MKEIHIEVRDIEVFKKALGKVVDIVYTDEKVPQYFGMKVLVKEYVPKDKVLMVDTKGNLIQTFNLSTN